MKIAVLTLTLHTNYGGILQAYALQTILERMGHEVEVLNRPFKPSKTKWSQIPKRVIKKILGHDVIIFSEKRFYREAPTINHHIWEFRKKYIHERLVNSLAELKESDYDCIVVGSDQVWRPRYFKEQWQTGIEDAFLAFTKGWRIKRIAYAVSFGVDSWEYTNEETEKCREAIKMFDAISVRELSGVKLLKDNLYANASYAVDPTLLLNKQDYYSLFADRICKTSPNMLLVYILDKNNRNNALVNKIAQETGFTPLAINHFFVKKTDTVDKRVLPPIESWLKGFDEAKLVITDSFHASVFSLIFDKPLVIISDKERGNARINDLLDFLGNSISHLDGIKIYNDRCSSAGYNAQMKVLNLKRKQSFIYLSDSVSNI